MQFSSEAKAICQKMLFSFAEHPESNAHGWGWVLGAVTVPDISHNEFLEECVQQGCYLMLFAYVLQKLPMSQSLEDEYKHLNHLITWTGQVKPKYEYECSKHKRNKRNSSMLTQLRRTLLPFELSEKICCSFLMQSCFCFRTDNEAKLFLWFAKVIELVLRQLHYGSATSLLNQTLQTFVSSLQTLGEDKSHSGLLGAIGLGKRSQLSLRYDPNSDAK